MNNMDLTYNAQSRIREAENLHRAAIEISKHVFGTGELRNTILYAKSRLALGG